jgi:XisH protein
MAKDIFHNIVVESLIADGWDITHDGYKLLTELLKDALTIDIGAEKLITATKQTEKIAVEVKSFLGDSLIYDFHGALGQLLVYKVNIELQEPDRKLYLAIPEATFEKMSQQRIFDVVAERFEVNYLVYNPNQKQILKWINHSKSSNTNS